jgi:hypothetical protein
MYKDDKLILDAFYVFIEDLWKNHFQLF